MRSPLPLLAIAAIALAACTDSSRSITAPTPLADAGAALDPRHGGAAGGVFTETNASTGNAVVAFARAADGTLSLVGTYATGGLGTGGTVDPLASQYALALDESKRHLVAVNAGSDEISSFDVSGGALRLVQTVSSGGAHPVSVAISRGVLYVLDAGSNTLAGFRLASDGSLTPVPSWTRSLSPGAGGAAVVRFSRDGRMLAVAERTSQSIDTYVVDSDGSLGEAVQNHANAPVPFGFDFTSHGTLVVSEAASGSVSSYDPAGDGTLRLVSASVSTGQQATCWVIVTRDGRFAYSANAGSGTISGLAVSASGNLSLVTAGGVTANVGAGSTPLDLDESRDGRFLYVLEAGTGDIGAYAIGPDGSLTPVSQTAALTPRSGQMGLAAY